MAFNITSSPSNAEILASLLGDTTGLSNIQITTTGNPLAVGLFQDSPVNLSSGVLLSTGQADRIRGSNASDRNNVSNVFNGSGTVPDGNDAITLEITFDADAVSRQLFFQYVFGSEEFLDFAGSSFNDRLTIELNGVNLAKLNNGNLVDVNSLTPGTDPNAFSPDYINNLSVSNPAYEQTVLDGYTVPITLQGSLLSSASNRLVITIQDIGDGAVDSAVFLAAGSLGVSTPIPTVNVTAELPSSVDEDSVSGILYTFTRTGAIDKVLSVNYRLGGTATFDTDYSSPNFPGQSGTIDFAAGSASTTIFISPTIDALVEGDETITVNLLPANSFEYNVGAAGAATGTILDEDTPLNNISLTILSDLVSEDSISGNLVYSFTRTGPTTESLRVDFDLGGTALWVDDYDVLGASFIQGSIGSITFSAGSDQTFLLIDPKPDNVTEPLETVELTLTPSRNDSQIGGRSRSYIIDTPSAVTGNIIDAQPARPSISLSINSSIVGENDQTSLSYIFTRTGSLTSALTVQYFVRGTARLGEDYAVAGAASFDDTIGTVTFQAGAEFAVVDVAPTPDSVTEPTETVILQLDTIAGAIGGYDVNTFLEVVGSIVDAATPIINIVLEPQVVDEGSQTHLFYGFSRSGSTNDALTVNYNISGTATFGADYNQTGASSFDGTSGSITFAIGSSTANLEITPVTDAILEPDETIVLTLADNQNCAIGNNNNSTGTIRDVPAIIPATVSLALNRATVNEDGIPNLSYTFTRDGLTDRPLTVRYQIAGTAIEDTDYSTLGTSTGESLRTFDFAAGASTFTIRVDPTADAVVEGDETVSLTLLPAGLGYGNTEYIVNNSAAVLGTIIDGGLPLPVIDISLASASVTEDGQANLVYRFTRSGSTNQPLTIRYSVGGTAAFTADYAQSGGNGFTDNTGSITFAANSNTVLLAVDPVADTVSESDETVVLTLVDDPTYTINSSSSSSSGTIVDVPPIVIGTPPTISLAVNQASANEDSMTSLTYTFTRTGSTQDPLTVSYRVGGTANRLSGAANATSDYVLNTSVAGSIHTVTFSTGSNTTTISATPTSDRIIEGDETVELTLVPAGNGQYIIGTTAAVVGTILDQDDNSVSLAVSPSQVVEDGTENLVYTFTRTGSTSEASFVDYELGGNAVIGTDYILTGANFPGNTSSGTVTLNIGTVNFAAGSDTATVIVDPTTDTIAETNENITLRLVPSRLDTIFGGRTYNISTPDAISGIITDVTPTVSVSLEGNSVNEDGSTSLIYSFTRTGSLGTSLTATYNVSGTAIFGDDYTQTGARNFTVNTGTIEFAANSSTTTLTVTPIADAITEQNETVIVTLVDGASNLAPYRINSFNNATGTIVDTPPVVLPTTATIRTSAGDGELIVSVDQFGRFGSASGVGGDALYDPLGGIASAGTTYSSYVALGIIAADGSTAARTVLEPVASSDEGFTNVNITTANSGFTIRGLQFQLNQLVQDARNTEQNRTGGRLDQTYTVTNTTSQTISFELVRYVDGDLSFDNNIDDGGGRIVQNGQEILFETDRGGTGQTDTTFFGITATGGTIPTTNRFEIDTFNTLDTNILAGSILRDRIIQGDANSDLFVDPGAEYDITLGLRNTFSLAPGASSIYTTTTRFGSGEPAQLDITPPIGGINNLALTTLGTNINLAWNATDPSGVRGYDVFVSTNGGAYTSFQAGVTTTSAVFTGVIGNTYAFYVLATDNAGNSQVVTGAPIATTQLVTTLPPDTPPVVTLTVNPISVDESATSGIVYTFTRTGSLGTSLTASYNVSGTATFRDDYIQTGANNFAVGTGTIEFAANSSTATLTITPIADSVTEQNETVDLTLLSGSGYGDSNYIVGTPDTQTGTIININEPPTSGLNFIGTNNLDVGTVNNSSNGVFAVNPSNINFVGDEINLLGGADSVTVPNKIVILQPNSPNQAIQIGSVDSNSASVLDLTPIDLAALSNGFSRMIFGRANGTGNIDVNSNIIFRDPVLFQSPGGQLSITAPISLIDDATLDFNVQALVKSGASTLTINGTTVTTFIGNTTINGGVLVLAKSPNTEALLNAPILINSGVLRLGNNEQINNGADLTLNGGTFNLNGFNETLDRLQVTSNSIINLGNARSKLGFANSSTANWTGVLSIENWSSTNSESIRFGNSSNGLTAAQLSNIQFIGFSRGANINTSGFITPVGITVINPTPDQDGVSEDIEDLAPNSGDGNFDAIRDGLQENVASILNLGSTDINGISTIIARAGAKISGLRSLANPITTATLTSLANPIEFKVTGLANGAATTVEYIISKADQNRRYNTYLMFGATADNATPHAYEFLYDGRTGAELFDTNSDGFVDKAIIHFIDGQRGDSDLTVNGEIQDPGAPGISSTPISLSIDTNNVVQLIGTAGSAVASFSLVANQTKQVNEVGFFKIDVANTVSGIAANGAGFARTALQSGQVIFSSLADNLLNTADISRQLQLNAGDRLGFYLVQNGTVDNALQKNDFSKVLFSIDQANPASRKALEVTTETNGSYRLKWEQGSATVADDLILNLQLQSNPLNNQNLVAGIQGDRESELLDLSSFTGQDVQVNFTIKREAAFNDTVGFYKVEDAQGTLISVTGAKIKPGETGYQAAVVQNRITGVDLAVANGQTASIDAVLRGGAIYAPFLIANANPGNLNGNFSNVYTSYTVGNSDTTDHVRLLGDNTFGFEDLAGGGDQDFNDVVLKAVFKNS